jgi:hypothetical protein
MRFIPAIFLLCSLVYSGCNNAPEVVGGKPGKDSDKESELTKKSVKKKETNSQSGKKCFGLVNGQDTEQYLPSVYLGRKVGANGLEECSGTHVSMSWMGRRLSAWTA